MSIRNLVVVGGSLAGLRAVQSARETGFDGTITLVGAEEHAPYDRTLLSKGFLSAEARPAVPVYYDPAALTGELGAELVLGSPATQLDTEGRAVVLGNGRRIGYEALVIATGVRARTLPGSGGLAGVHTLRTVADADAIRDRLATAGHVVIVGGGFVGSEVASSAHARGLKVTVVDADPTPLSGVVGREMALACSSLHSAYGTDLRTGVGVHWIEGRGQVERVALTDGSIVPADLVVVGIGSVAVTDWLAGSGVTVLDGVVCDRYLRTGVPGVHAAGDLAHWQNTFSHRRMRVEHWSSAAAQGSAAGRNAVSPDDPVPCPVVPYFWSDWYGNRIQCAGTTAGDPAEVLGDPGAHRFVALYREDDRLAGVLAMNDKGAFARYRAQVRAKAAWTDALARTAGTADHGR